MRPVHKEIPGIFPQLWWIMSDFRYAAIATLLRALHLSGLDRALAPVCQGAGVILTMHHVRPDRTGDFAPNRILEITPEFLDDVLCLLKAQGFEIAKLDEVPIRLAGAGKAKRPFAVLTFDDGYKDNLEYALPVLRTHSAPCTVFVTRGFVDGTSPLWWLDLEEAISRQNQITVDLPEGRVTIPTATAAEKAAGFEKVYWALRPGPEETFRRVVADLAADAGVDPLARTRSLCLDWSGIRDLASDPLVTIGAHSLTHPMLAKHEDTVARKEMAESKGALETELGREVRHFAYPVGDPGSAGQREFALARACGFETAVTTRPGMLFPGHGSHLTALPRISLNGLFQRKGDVAALLSGVPTALQNRGRRLNVA